MVVTITRADGANSTQHPLDAERSRLECQTDEAHLYLVGPGWQFYAEGIPVPNGNELELCRSPIELTTDDGNFGFEFAEDYDVEGTHAQLRFSQGEVGFLRVAVEAKGQGKQLGAFTLTAAVELPLGVHDRWTAEIYFGMEPTPIERGEDAEAFWSQIVEHLAQVGREVSLVSLWHDRTDQILRAYGQSDRLVIEGQLRTDGACRSVVVHRLGVETPRELTYCPDEYNQALTVLSDELLQTEEAVRVFRRFYLQRDVALGFGLRDKAYLW
jgi:hypothetical protein